MQFTKELNRLMLGITIAFLGIAIAAAYWAIAGPETILAREDNPRLVVAEAAIRRGSIFDRENRLLAETIVNEGNLQRVYHAASANSILGYHSLRHGAGGVEAAYDAILRGGTLEPTFSQFFQQDLLHQPRFGSDIRLSLDLEIQQQLARAMGKRRGAIIVMRVPDGALLGLISQPTFDPNTLDEEWDVLKNAPGNPFFNRALQGNYQPGGILQTPLMAAGILTQQPFDSVMNDANASVTVSDLELSCVMDPPEADLAFTTAYAYACPRPFELLAQRINNTTLANTLNAFRLNDPPVLPGFADNITEVEMTPEAIPFDATSSTLREDLLGQGELTINPLSMLTLVASIANQGNAPQPYILSAVRPPGRDWQSVAQARPSLALMTEATARRMRDLMINNTRIGASAPAARVGLNIGAHTALAYSGDETLTWFTGFVSLPDNRAAIVIIVLENTNNSRIVADIGGSVLQSTYEIFNQAAD